MRTHMVLAVLLAHVAFCQAFWWWFGSSEEDEKAHEGAKPTGAFQEMFAPFEITKVETQFLSEASHYLGNLPKLDQCNLLIINRLRSSCNKLTELAISKLSVNLLNCQSAVEGRKVYRCTDDMTLSECTQRMDSDTWNAYHVVSNRARAVCYSVRQTEFRVKTEMTINSLASSAKENLASLKNLLDSQKDLSNKTSETFSQVVEGSDRAIKIQTELSVKQSSLKEAITDNIQKLSQEKRMIESRHKDIHKHSTEVKKDLDDIAGAIQKHHFARTSSDKELLLQVETIQARAKDVLQKLDKAVGKMDSHYESIEDRHSKILDNVHDIQQAINFISEMIVNFEESFQRQMKWINGVVGGTRDKLSVVSILFGHMVLLFVMLMIVVSCSAPLLSKIVVLLLIPINCIFALQNRQHFTYKEMLLVVALSYPVSWVASSTSSLTMPSMNLALTGKRMAKALASIPTRLITVLRRPVPLKQQVSNANEHKACQDLDFNDSVEYSLDDTQLTSTPQKFTYNTSDDRLHNSSLGSVQRRCGSLTRTGQRCKLFCRRGSHSCARHENSYNSYLDQSSNDSPTRS